MQPLSSSHVVLFPWSLTRDREMKCRYTGRGHPAREGVRGVQGHGRCGQGREHQDDDDVHAHVQRRLVEEH
jgi:hypothetical protein